MELTRIEKNQFLIQYKEFSIFVPSIYKKKFDEVLDTEIKNCESDPSKDVFGLNSSNRSYVKNRESLRQKCLFLLGIIYYVMKPKLRVGKGKVLCADLSENYLSTILGDCTRNKVRIGWKSIKDFLIQSQLIEISDKTIIHDSIYGLEPQSIAWTLYGLKDVKHKPFAHVYKSGRKGCTCKKFKFEDFVLEPVLINDKVLLNSLSRNRVSYIRSSSVSGIQAVMLAKLGIDDESYDHIRKTYNDDTDETLSKDEDIDNNKKIRKEVSNRFLNAIHNNTPWELSVSHSVKTNRIYTGLTTLRKELRPFLYVKDFPEQKLVELDSRASQLTLLTGLYYKNTYDRNPFEICVYNDIYNRLAYMCTQVDGTREYTREEMKSEVFHYIFSNRYSHKNPIFDKAMRGVFGDKFVNFIDKCRGRKHTGKLAKLLQNYEARIFVGAWNINAQIGGAILCKLYQEGIFALSIHDSIVVMMKDLEVARYHMLKQLIAGFKWIFNLNVTKDEVSRLITTKIWEKPILN